ncbi:MAG: PKD domain-containing protein [Saprospiraceae bacterium]
MNQPTIYTKRGVLALLLCFFLTHHAQAQIPGIDIQGPLVTCSNECVNYTVSGIEALPPGQVTYFWHATGSDIFFPGGWDYEVSTLTPSVEICWNIASWLGNAAGTLTLQIYVNNIPVHIETLSVLAGYTSVGETILSGTYCPLQIGIESGLGSISACEGLVVRYSIWPAVIAPDIVWVVEGSSNYVVNPDNTITVQWDHAVNGRVRALYPQSPCLSSNLYASSSGAEIFEKPVAAFTTDPPPQNSELKVCKGQQVFFFNQTTNASTYAWSLGNGISRAFNPIVTYDTPGTYEVVLHAYNECNCQDTAKMTIIVEDAFTPEIDCQSTVCVGDSATYQTAADCGTFLWTVNAQGVITAGGSTTDNYVTVHWTAGGTGTVELAVEGCAGVETICETKTLAEIPIITDGIGIEGSEKVCIGERAIYKVPDFTGTTIQWTVTGGSLLSQGYKETTVIWPALQTPIQRRVIVSYNNCYLGCGGTDTLDVFSQPAFQIEGDLEACAGGTTLHEAVSETGLATCEWSAFNSAGTLVWSSATPATSVAIPWEVSGDYLLKATPVNLNDYCVNETSVRIAVVNAPPAPDSIIGAAQICIGETYFYQAEGFEQGAPLHWYINNGGVVTESSGSSTDVLWGAFPPYEVSLTQTGIAGGGCVSEATTLTAVPLTAAPVLNGPASTCVGARTTYTATGLTSGNFRWSITPQSAGVVISNQNSGTIEVQWSRSGSATVVFEYCNLSAAFPVEVQTTSPPEVIAPANLCENETTLVQTTLPFTDYVWKTENGSIASTAATPELAAGYYTLEATSELGCVGTRVFHIVELPAPEVRISASSLRCIDLGAPDLFALNTVTGYAYDWRHNNNLTGQMTPMVTASQAGIYQVEVSDINGCRSQSNLLSVAANCLQSGGSFPGLPGEAVICLSGDLDFQVNPSGVCNDRSYAAEGNNIVPGSVRWSFGDPGSGASNNTAMGMTASHMFSNAGFYEIAMVADVNQGGTTTTCGVLFIDTVWARANFAYTKACAGESVQFVDRATFIPTISIAAWQWDFGDPASGTANFSDQSNPTHIFSAPGAYTVTLTITSSTGCTSAYTETVTIFGPPEMEMNLPPAFCENTAYLFTATATEEPAIWSWNFDALPGGVELIGNSIYHAYPTPGTYQIELTATSRYGCTGSMAETITVGNGATSLSGVIQSSLDIPFCEGDTTLLSAPIGGIAWNWSQSAVTSSIGTSKPGLYFVAVTDPQGCQYLPPPFIVRLLELPTASIRAIAYDADQVAQGYTYHELEICEGENVYLEVLTAPGNPILWSNGAETTQTEYSSLRGTLLPAGVHHISASVLDTASGCTALATFVITVHAKPIVPLITSPPGNICEGTPTTFRVTNPNSELLYLWNIGQTADSIVTSLSGSYYVEAFNEFGCSARSGTRRIIPAPSLRHFPGGCYSRCSPDTICVPPISGVGAYQWFLNGAPVAGATTPSFIAHESGSYQLQVTQQYQPFCSRISIPLVLDLYEGVSPIDGEVYFDVNGNQIIDPADTLAAGIGVVLLHPDGTIGTTTSGVAGAFGFSEKAAGGYVISINSAQLSPDFQAITQPLSINHSGCSPWRVRLLIGPACQPASSVTELTICEGISFIYGGVTIESDTTFTLQHAMPNGCDSLELVQIQSAASSVTDLTIGVCPGESATYQGMALQAGSTTDFILTNAMNCDSLVKVTVTELFVSASALTLQTCPGEEAIYNNTPLQGGTTTDFVFTNSVGCDSVVTVSVTTLLEPATSLTLQTCPGEEAIYNNTPLEAGTTTDFVFTNSAGCDSLVIVTVAALELSDTVVNLAACTGTTVVYEGVSILAGETVTLNFPDIHGCDSTITVIVAALSLPEIEAAIDPSCPQTQTGTITIVTTQGGQPPYLYALDGQNYAMASAFTALESGAYTVSVRDVHDCLTNMEVVVSELSSLLLAGDLSQVLPCNPHELRLQPMLISGDFGDLTYQWSTGETTSEITIDTAGHYQVQVSNDCETQVQDIQVLAPEASGTEIFYVPNAFSPNQDGINDQFEILPGTHVTVMKFKLMIFDRWGNFVFSASDISNGWDGQFLGRPASMGVYVWSLEATVLVCGEQQRIERKGDVVLLR